MLPIVQRGTYHVTRMCSTDVHSVRCPCSVCSAAVSIRGTRPGVREQVGAWALRTVRPRNRSEPGAGAPRWGPWGRGARPRDVPVLQIWSRSARSSSASCCVRPPPVRPVDDGPLGTAVPCTRGQQDELIIFDFEVYRDLLVLVILLMFHRRLRVAPLWTE